MAAGRAFLILVEFGFVSGFVNGDLNVNRFLFVVAKIVDGSENILILKFFFKLLNEKDSSYNAASKAHCAECAGSITLVSEKKNKYE